MHKTILVFFLNLGLLSVTTACIPAQGGTPPLSLTLFLIGFCILFLLLIGVIVLGIIVRRENRKENKKN